MQYELVFGGDGAADVVDVLGGGERYGIAPDAAAQVVDGVGVDLHDLAAQEGAGVGDVAACVVLYPAAQLRLHVGSAVVEDDASVNFVMLETGSERGGTFCVPLQG